MTWAEVAGRMRQNPAALCVVNTKAAARAVFDALTAAGAAGVFHLSTAMCPAHRLEQLDAIRERLKKGEPTYVASTQLIEAGVDVSFPFVMREMGPLDSVIQAAGRCNREGELPNAGGRVEVFRVADGKLPPGWYEKGRDIVQNNFLNAGRLPRIDAPEDIRDYYERLYYSGDIDEHKIATPPRGSLREQFAFATIADKYRLIDDAGVPVLVMKWPGREAEVERLAEWVRNKATRTKAAFRALGRFQVNVRFRELSKLQARGLVYPIDPDLDLLGWDGEYDPDLGLIADDVDRVLIG